MQLGMVGLGRMGANLTRRLMRGGHEVIGYDVNPDSVRQLEDEGSIGTASLEDLVHKLAKPAKAPRVVAGEYALTGSFKVVAVGSGLFGNDGIQADALVQIVADCLVS